MNGSMAIERFFEYQRANCKKIPSGMIPSPFPSLKPGSATAS